MKYLYNIKNNFYIALSLVILAASIILTSFLEKQNLLTIEKSFNSIFADRLVPATDIFVIADQLYTRRLDLQSIIYSRETNEADLPDFAEQNYFLDSIMEKYQKTYLVKNEEVCIDRFSSNWESYKAREEKVLELSRTANNDEAIAVFNSSDVLFRSLITDLQQLSKIQSEVGEDLNQTSKTSIASTNSIFSLQFGIIIIITLICNGLLFAAKVVWQPKQKFHLN